MDPSQVEQLEERCRQLEEQVELLNDTLDYKNKQREEEEGERLRAAVQADFELKAYKRRHVHISTMIAALVIVILAFALEMRGDAKKADIMIEEAYQSGWDDAYEAACDEIAAADEDDNNDVYFLGWTHGYEHGYDDGANGAAFDNDLPDGWVW